MDRYFTVMVVPEREKGVRSFRIPRVLFHALIFLSVAFVALLALLSYDYWKILKQVYENKHLTIENRQLKEQIQLFHMKMNSLAEDIERINTFEKKLRVITGLEQVDLSQSVRGATDLNPEPPGPKIEDEGWPRRSGTAPKEGVPRNPSSQNSSPASHATRPANYSSVIPPHFKEEERYQELKKLYEQKIATSFGLITSYQFTKEWSELTKQSFALADQFAEFDTKFLHVKGFVKTLEVKVHELDQFLLDQDSFLRSTPTLLPAKGWITSYYGPRMSHYSGRVKMHEGLDVGARPGTPIVAPADGIVTFSGIKPGFGKFVQVDHGYGVETIYAHANSLEIKKGEKVRRGDLLATVGNTGYSTGPHLHYEVRVNGTPVDPLYYILD